MNLIQAGDIIREIVLKEDERYRLSYYALIASKEDTIRQLCSDGELVRNYAQLKFSDFKNQVITVLYTKYISSRKITEFINNKEESHNWLFVIYKNILSRKRKKHVGKTIDDEIRTKGRTLAFKASKSLMREIYSLNVVNHLFPDRIENELTAVCSSTYPIMVKGLSERLYKEDACFWEEISIVLYNIAASVVNYYSSILNYRFKNSDDLKSDVWQKADKKVKELIVSGQNPDFENGIHFRAYIEKVTCGILRNFLPKEKKEKDIHVAIDDIKEIGFADDQQGYMDESSLTDIDPDNLQEFQCSLVTILCSQQGCAYETIINGIEDKVQVLMQNSIDKISYKEIVKQKFGDQLSEDEENRKVMTMRQNASRVKDTLIDRFYKYLKQKNKAFKP